MSSHDTSLRRWPQNMRNPSLNQCQRNGTAIAYPIFFTRLHPTMPLSIEMALCFFNCDLWNGNHHFAEWMCNDISFHSNQSTHPICSGLFRRSVFEESFFLFRSRRDRLEVDDLSSMKFSQDLDFVFLYHDPIRPAWNA